MGYVPDSLHDIFLSYSHKDDLTWISAFQEGLLQELRGKLGVDPKFWQDTGKLRLGMDWSGAIEEAIAGAAIFVAILSPGYQKSDWCKRERQAFRNRFGSLDEMKVRLAGGNAFRFLKIIKFPWDEDAHLEFFSEAQNLDFFSRGSNGIDRDLVPGTEAFRSRLEEAAYHIAALLKAMRRRGEAVFVATPAKDVEATAEDLRNELQARGYLVRPEGPMDEMYSDKAIRAQIEPAEIGVHLLGTAYDAFAERQLDLSIEHSKRLLFWAPRDAREKADARQQALIDRIQQAKNIQVPFTLLEDASSRSMIAEVLSALKPKRVETAVANGKRSIYIVCDPSAGPDCSFARFLQEQIQNREGLSVYLPEARPASNQTPDAIHQQRMRECDSVLLYRNAAPLNWLIQQTPNVLFAEQILQRRPLLSRAFLLDDPTVLKDLPHVIRRPENFQMEDLRPFLEPLRQGLHAGG